MEILFSAQSLGGAYQGAFAAFASQAALVSTQVPPSFWFSQEPFQAACVFSFPSDGLYQVTGNLYDYELLYFEPTEELEVDPFLAMASLYVKVVQGNAIEISEKQYRHELDKSIQEKNEGRALGRVIKELEYAAEHIGDFGVEEGDYAQRFVQVENDLGLDVNVDNGDLHQQLLETQVGQICPKCPILKRFCLKYTLVPSLNVPITLSANLRYEDPGGLIHCDPITNICSPGAKPVKSQEVFVAVRSYVTVKCQNPPPLPLFTFFTTIKTTLYRFNTNELGTLSGTIWAAPPFDQGMPYVEYLDARTVGVYEGAAITPAEYRVASDQLEVYPPRYANSVVLPSVCFTNDTTINCAGQSFDPATNTLSMDALYKESVEPRTFFLSWRQRLSTVRQRWGGWGIYDTCSPLRAVWLSNWDAICGADDTCKETYRDSGCLFNAKNPQCDTPAPATGDIVTNPSILIRPRNDGHESWIKWKAEFPYHESGHWLWFLMQGNQYMTDIASPAPRALTAAEKCRRGAWSASEGNGTLKEAFAESHLLNFAIVGETGYGVYERAANGEVDTRCEKPYMDYSGEIPTQASYNCPKCAPCFEALPEINVGQNHYTCETYYSISCTDLDQTPCNLGPYGTQAALLMDVYDDVNAPYNDGTPNGMRFDMVHKPLGAVAQCFFDAAKTGNTITINSHIGQFLDALIARCGAPQGQIDSLRVFFGAP